VTDPSEHYRRLERMYLGAPINQIYSPSITVSEGSATVEFAAREGLFHAAGSLHGSVYFKGLDDAAFFAAASLVPDRFVVTVSFTVYLTRPVTGGELRADGRVATHTKNLLVAESVLYNGDREVARGSGTFVPSRTELTPELGYR
jgi:uncharacterized protein (TIGR00369 family)